MLTITNKGNARNRASERTFTVERDPHPTNPRLSEHLGTILLWGTDIDSPDDNPYRTSSDILADMLVRYGDISGFVDDLNDGDIDGMHLSSEWHDGETGHDADDTIDEFLDESSKLHGRKHGMYLYEHKCHWGVSEDPDLPVAEIANVLALHQTAAIDYLDGNVEIIPIYAIGDVLTCEQLNAFDTPQVGWAYATRDDIDSWYGDDMSDDSFVVRSRPCLASMTAPSV